MSVLRGNVKMAAASMRNTKWRSFLTMLGIIIGVASVVTVVSIGEGIKHQIDGQIDQLGRDLITVRPGLPPQHTNNGAIENIKVILGPGSGGTLSEQDVATVAKTEGIGLAVPLSTVQGEVSVGERKLASQSPIVLGTTSELASMLHGPVEHGSFFDEMGIREEPNVAVIGLNVARNLFQQSVPVGRSFEFLGQQFIVQGVLKQFDTTPLSLATDFNDTIFIPYSTAQKLTGNNARIYQILAKPADASQLDSAVANTNASLKSAHQGQQQFSVLRQDESLAVTNTILDLLTKLTTGIAAISLLVGGIGIMNIMLVSVAERMHEIGIRKALGANNRQIMMQFMAEALVLSACGAFIGILLSLLLNFILHISTTFSPILNWQVMAGAALVSLLVGVIFGTAPAIKAARKDPIDALRNE